MIVDFNLTTTEILSCLGIGMLVALALTIQYVAISTGIIAIVSCLLKPGTLLSVGLSIYF